MPDREIEREASPTKFRPTPVLDAVLGRAVTIPSTAVRAHVDSVRRRNPGASPAQILDLLEREYLAVVSTTGGAVGAAAAIPAVGTGAALLLTGSDVATFFGASAAFSLAVADVHGIAVDDVERRRALLLASVLGEKAARDVEKAAGGSTIAWGKLLVTKMPQGTLKQVNRALSSRFLRTQLVKQGGLAMGRIVPFGVGAVVGVAGGRALGHGVIAQSRTAFGAPPERFPRILEVVEGGGADDVPTLEALVVEPEDTKKPRRRLLGRKP
ncbi:hypothetical protein SAMN04489860_1034 [Paraoerskovia marina]|uniref:EcsC protein family protein n=1 Tax=Paraoerskovia marina TaxID=545619 RepID=A0A1H1QCH9_9CELL|nr:hypothetical protein [Paraoerskovia marina]SDS20579.1 hypothetical protein SAMN04489860_1034 [Paraoerskovia marina]